MAYDGYLRFGGSEIINAERTAAYVLALTPSLSLTNCSDCDVLRFDVNQKNTPSELFIGPVRYDKPGSQYERETRYVTPREDRADWFDPDDPDSADFAGLYPLSISGIDDDSVGARVVENSGDGGTALGVRRGTKEVRVTGLLIGKTSRALDYGMRWLRKSLDSGDCSGDCDGTDLCFYSACPPAIRLDGYDYDSPPSFYFSGAAFGWRTRGTGGTMTPDTVTGKLTYQSNNFLGLNPDIDEDYSGLPVTGPAFIEYSPVHAVDDEMKFGVVFDPATVVSSIVRKNLVPNPAFRAVNGTAVVRRNLAKNPTGRTDTSQWATTNGSVTMSRSGDVPLDPQRPDIAASGPVQYFLRGTANAVVAKAATGYRTTVTLTSDTMPLRIAGLVNAPLLANVTISVQWLNASNAQVSTIATANVTTGSTDAWVNFSAAFTPPATAVTAVVTFAGAAAEVGNFAIGDRVVELSALMVEHATTSGVAHDYFDGTYFDSTLYYNGGAVNQWVGTPDASESVIVGPSVSTFAGATGVGLYRNTNNRIRLHLRAARTANSIVTSANFAHTTGPISGRIQLRGIAGTAGNVRLTLRAYSAANVALGVVAQSALTAVPMTNTTMSVVAPANAALPATTAYVRAEVTFDNGGGTFISACVLEFSNLLVQPVATTTSSAASFFDGETVDSVNYEYRWEGDPNDSVSIALDRSVPTSVPVRLEAFADGVRIASAEGNSVDGRLELAVDGRGHSVIQWRLIPLAIDAVVLTDVEFSWHVRIDYERVYADYERFVEFYGPEPPGSGGGGVIPLPSLIDNQFRKYRRQLRRVTRVEGPTVIEEYRKGSACMARVEFTLVAGSPYIFGEETGFIGLPLKKASYLLNSPEDTGGAFIVSDAIARCTPLMPASAVVNPNCPIPPTAPTPPVITSSCTSPKGPVLNRFGLYIDGKLLPKHGEVVPILEFYGENFTSERVNVMFYPMPVETRDTTTIEPCSVCADITVLHFDSDGVIMDGSREKTYVVQREIAPDADGVYQYTGRSVQRPAAHLLSSLNGTPLQYPVLTCGVGYLMVIETYADRQSYVSLRLVPRL